MNSTDTRETLDAAAPKLQIWNNAAFDNGDGDSSAMIQASWSSSGLINESFDSDCSSKENQIPLSVSSSFQSSVNSMTEPPRAFPSAKSKIVKAKYNGDQIKRRDIDAEIEEVEKEIGRLSNKLESLRLEKAEQTARSIAIRGRIVPAKFMESAKQQTVKIDDSSFPTGSKSRTMRRGVSMGPGEIFSAPKKSDTVTPLQSAQNRRKSCFWKLPGIEEGKVTKARGLSLSPRSRKAATVAQKQAATTVGSKRAVKREETVLSSIQPKKLFKEEEKNVVAPSRKPGRVVASRYSLISKTVEKDSRRKRSLPENEEKENHQRSEKRRASDENNNKSEGRVKKRWEIPNQVELYSTGLNHGTTTTTTPLELPKIRTLRCVAESPRDSGAAKRVSELESKDRSFTFCQLLRFEE